MRQRAVCGERVLPSGFTLLEVIVALAILGVTLGATALALGSLRAPRESEWIRELRRARAEAIRGGRSVEIRDSRSPLTAHALFLPDGRALGHAIDPLTGAPDSTEPRGPL